MTPLSTTEQFRKWIKKKIPQGSPLWLLYRYCYKFVTKLITGQPVTIYLYKIHDNIALEGLKAIYFPIPKVACSSLKKVCADLLQMQISSGDMKEDIHYQHFPYVKKYKINTDYKDYFKFCFVRNPWARVVSCYFNKVYVEPGETREDTRFLGFGDNRKHFRMGMGFEEFVEAVCRIPDKKADSHLVSQHTFLTDSAGNLLVDFIGKIETFEEDFQYICEQMNVKELEIPHLMKSKQVDYCSYYSEKTKEMVRRRYERDIDLFGYGFTPEAS